MEHHNLIWVYNSGDWQCSAGAESTVGTCAGSDHPPLFEEGFFTNPVMFTPGHDQQLSFALAAGSPAINAGDATNQPAYPQGLLSEDGFILPALNARDADHHSIGPYEP